MPRFYIHPASIQASSSEVQASNPIPAPAVNDDDDWREMKYNDQGDVIPPPNQDASSSSSSIDLHAGIEQICIQDSDEEDAEHPVTFHADEQDIDHISESDLEDTSTSLDQEQQDPNHNIPASMIRGPLWNWQGSSTHWHPKLWAYDTFCMVFLDRPGSYYKIDQPIRHTRGIEFSSSGLIARLKEYRRIMNIEHTSLMNWQHLRDWWKPSREVKRYIQNIEPGYSFRYATVFLVGFKSLQIYHSQQNKNDRVFFLSMRYYLALFLSSYVELKISRPVTLNIEYNLNSLNWGVFAKVNLYHNHQVQDVIGELQLVGEDEYQQLRLYNQAFSILEIEHTSATQDRLFTSDPPTHPQESNQISSRSRRYHKRRKKTHSQASSQPAVRRKAISYYVVLGGMAFINDACIEHSNIYPCQWVNGNQEGEEDAEEEEEENGIYQWRCITLKQREIHKGQELYTAYSNKKETCVLCHP